MITFALILLTSLFFPGIIVRVKSLASGRKGPGIFQPWKDILLLLKKSSIYSSTTSFIFQIAPIIYFSTILCTILLVPFSNSPAIIGFNGDFILFAYLLGLGRFFFIINAMDTGSSFEGMGASREALYAMLLEPAFFILVGSVALLAGHLSMQELFSSFLLTNNYHLIIRIIMIYLFVQIAMIENSRLPVDDPKTHLELTMIHEVMVLDNSGFELAIVKISSILKFAIFGTLISDLIITPTLPFALQIVVYFVVQVLFAATIGLLESFRARKMLVKNSQFILSLSSIAFVVFILCLLLLNQMLK